MVKGGRTLYGFPVGMVMTDSRFPRIPGDNGHAATWPFPMLYRSVPGAGPGRVVRMLSEAELLEPFIEASLELERAGVEVVTTSCGFLVLFQRRVQERLSVPFLSSSLLQAPWVASLLPPGRRVGVLTIEKRSLTPAHLEAAGIRPELGVAVLGMEETGGHFVDVVLGDRDQLDVARARAEHEQAARTLVERHPDVGAIVLECTNMPPYADTVRRVSQLPVYDLTTLVRWAAAGVCPRGFDPPDE